MLGDLIYSGQNNGMQSEDFHEACDDLGPTLVFAKSEDGRVFGGFTSLSWQSEGGV